MRRCDFIAGLAGAAAWPMVARARQRAVPVMGLLSSAPFETFSDGLAGFRRGLAETGHVEGQNVAFEYRTAENQYDRLPALADDLVRRRVAAIFTAVKVNPALAAKAASQVTPIVFVMGADPVRSSVVASLSRPGGNITGVTSLGGELTPKRLALLHELVPAAETVAYLVNRTNPGYSETLLKERAEAARPRFFGCISRGRPVCRPHPQWAKSPAICPCSNRLGSRSPSTSRPPRRLALPFRRTYWPLPTR
jgi:putative tryptophan/tyrosine transport system substrate-binding protein